jgi:hypothetical protein
MKGHMIDPKESNVANKMDEEERITPTDLTPITE